MSFISAIKTPNNTNYSVRAAAIPYGEVDDTSTDTAFTATVNGVYELSDGVCVYLRNNVVTSAAGFTININGLGAKPVYSNMAAATAQTNLFNINYTVLFIYNETRISGGCWDFYRGYTVSNTDTIGYQLRTNTSALKTSDKGYRYRLWFTSLDGQKWIPANTSNAVAATTAKSPNTRVIDPFGPIIYYSVNEATEQDSTFSDLTKVWQQYNNIPLGCSFNSQGGTLTLTDNAPVYLKCTPQSGGGVLMDDTTQSLPSTADGKVYILLGYAYSATNIQFIMDHPIYYYSNGDIRLWTNNEVAKSYVDTQLATKEDKVSIIQIDNPVYTITPNGNSFYAGDTNVPMQQLYLDASVTTNFMTDIQFHTSSNDCLVQMTSDYIIPKGIQYTTSGNYKQIILEGGLFYEISVMNYALLVEAWQV